MQLSLYRALPEQEQLEQLQFLPTRQLFRTGVAATGATGSVTISGAATVVPTGVTATGSIGSVTVTSAANVVPTGVTATGAIGLLHKNR